MDQYEKLLTVNKLMKNFDCKEWLSREESLPHRTLTLDDNRQHTSRLHHYDKSSSRQKRGVYIHRRHDTKEVLYVGQTDRNIAGRQTSHARSFADENHEGESTGLKYRRYMKDRKLSELVISPSYIDLSSFQTGWPRLIEERYIEHLNPILNGYK
jgi:hypothetical protein